MSDALKSLIGKAADGPLSRAEAEAAFAIIMSGEATMAQIGGLLLALRTRGETVDEIAGAAAAMRAKAAAVLGQWDEVCGHANLCVFHLNDSVGELGSRKDRHAHIGHGTCGLACFGAIVNHRGFAGVPKVLETPKDRDEKGVPWDVRNIRRLKRLVRAPKSGR